MILKQFKYLLFFLLTFLFVAQTACAKTELVLSQNQVSLSIEQNQSFKNLEKELQPNIGFLKEKTRFVLSESISAQNPTIFSEIVNEDLDDAVGKTADELIASVDDVYKALLKADLDASDDLLKLLGKEPELLDSWRVLFKGKKSLRSIDNINSVNAFKRANPNISDDIIQSAIESLKSSRRQSFVDALKSCADNKNLIGSLKKSKLATVDEIKDALNKMRNYKTGKPQSGNLGYLESDIPGVVIENKFWKSVSEDIALAETHIFDAIEATGTSGTWKRITDSEYRMLNDLAKKLGGVKGGIKTDVSGTLKIVSENPYCTSCQGVIQQFSEMFPNIEIKLIDGVR